MKFPQDDWYIHISKDEDGPTNVNISHNHTECPSAGHRETLYDWVRPEPKKSWIDKLKEKYRRR